MRITNRALEQQLADLERKIVALEQELRACSSARTDSPAASRWRRCYRQMVTIEHRLAEQVLLATPRNAPAHNSSGAA